MSFQSLDSHNIEEYDSPSYPDSHAMTRTHSSAGPIPQHHLVAGSSHPDAVRGARVATAMLGSAQTLPVFATGQSVRPEPGRGRTAACRPVRSFSKVARQVGMGDEDGRHFVVPSGHFLRLPDKQKLKTRTDGILWSRPVLS